MGREGEKPGRAIQLARDWNLTWNAIQQIRFQQFAYLRESMLVCSRPRPQASELQMD